ncbi:hypothetical protein HNY73_017989 [Argiope bruennichi]|uniref:Uncharacterized protein n=1 Tax=Argiope bruennichi TaxID=94029 RepID=A0A8T0ECV5_ARGBR|nr:hypothetical protein HNY73_017989 [Argiope bruennichi]
MLKGNDSNDRSQNALAAVSHLMTMVLKATHSPSQSDNLPEYEMLANGNPGKKPAVRIQENPLAEVAVEKPPNDMVQLRIEKGGIKCQSSYHHIYHYSFNYMVFESLDQRKHLISICGMMDMCGLAVSLTR